MLNIASTCLGYLLIAAPNAVATDDAAKLVRRRVQVRECDDASCLYNSARTCMTAALNLGLDAGGDEFNFVGPWADKGCFYYPRDSISSFAGQAYFGSGGTEEQMKDRDIVTPGGSRLDCNTVVPPQTCNYNNIDACGRAALALGLQEGSEDFAFAASFADKGCFYYPPDCDSPFAGTAFFGLDGTVAQMETDTMVADHAMRLDCDTEV